MGEPETIVELPGRMALGFYIPQPFGKDTDAVLTVIAEDGTVRAAITNELQIEQPAKRMDMRLLQSNPRRTPEADDGD